MGRSWRDWKRFWVYILEPPWRHSGPEGTRVSHWGGWFVGWAWALAGFVLGALYAPSLVQFAGLSDSPYQDWLVIGVTVLVGFVAQSVGWWMVNLTARAAEPLAEAILGWPDLFQWPIGFCFVVLMLGVFALPFVGVGYGIHLYLSSVDTSQRTITIAFVGSLLIKTFIIPFIKSLVTGTAFKVLMAWLRGGKKKGSQSASVEAASQERKAPNPEGKGD